jgi:hypothetical protein
MWRDQEKVRSQEFITGLLSFFGKCLNRRNLWADTQDLTLRLLVEKGVFSKEEFSEMVKRPD